MTTPINLHNLNDFALKTFRKKCFGRLFQTIL